MEYGTIGTKPSPLRICTLKYLLHSGLELGEGEFILELLIASDTHAGSLFGVSEEKLFIILAFYRYSQVCLSLLLQKKSLLLILMTPSQCIFSMFLMTSSYPFAQQVCLYHQE